MYGKMRVAAERAAIHTLRPRAMTLIELLIALSITSMLLIAIAAAFHASAGAIARNDAYFQCTQSARVALERMTADIRRAEAVQVNPRGETIRIILPRELRGRDETFREFAYDPQARRITLQIFRDANTTEPLTDLATNITACTFGPAEMGTDNQHLPVTVLVPIRLTCSIDGGSVTLSASAGPRRQ